MSRAFNGTSDSITFAAGKAPETQGGDLLGGTGITIVVLAKSVSATGFTAWFARGRKAGAAVWSFLTSNNAGPKFFLENDFGNGVAGLTAGKWFYYVATKPNAAAVPRYHVQNVTDGGSFTHTAGTGFNVGNGVGPIDDILIGQAFPMSVAVAAAIPDEWTDSEIEARCTLAAADLLAGIGTAGWMARFNQSSTATAVVDDTANGGDQTAISGTTVDADDPPGYDYALTASPAEGTVALTLGLAVAPHGARAAAGHTDIGLGLAPLAAGGRPGAGHVALGLNLAAVSAGARASLGVANVPLVLTPAAVGSRPSAGRGALGLNLAVAGRGGSPSSGGSVALTLNLAVAASGGERSRSGRPRIDTSGPSGRIVSTTHNEPWEV